ncbi:hypothetical protein QFC22_000715 [Naganishia vaughanmartiniae]|uniref:Uncharacterized protein n=1 Tax=Naganishia vaughanmartiniae TaxID=1424756 RepID=A0ACC2XIR4_9TREE|nr:hypothetical protein QFC22_000715 [Naganishia vaughanmartiniae]
MADPLATIDAWGSPSASVAALPSVVDEEHQNDLPQASNGYSNDVSRGTAHDVDDDDDDNAPLSTTLQRAKDGQMAGSGASPAQKALPITPYLKVRITGLERNRKDLLIRFDANTNLPSFRTNMYRNMQRSYVEFQSFADHLAYANPQTILPALPLPQTSAITDDEDDRLVRIALQRWFTRVCEDPVLQQDNEMRSFIESDFGYQPAVKNMTHRATSSSSGGAFSSISRVFRKGPPDENEDLQIAKAELAKLEDKWAESAKAVAGTSKSRRALAPMLADTGGKMVSLASVESSMDLAAALRRLGKAFEAMGSIAQAQAISDNIILSDSLGYQSLHARQAKDTLIHRTQVLEDAQTASKNAIHKRRAVEKLRGNSRIDSSKVDDAIEEMREVSPERDFKYSGARLLILGIRQAQDLDETLARRVAAISTNLRAALQTHSRQAHDDAALMLIEHAKSKIMYEKQLLKELEAVRPEIANIGKPPHEKQKVRPVTSQPGFDARHASVPETSQPGGPSSMRPQIPHLTTNNMSQSMYTPPNPGMSSTPQRNPLPRMLSTGLQSAYPYQTPGPSPYSGHPTGYSPYTSQQAATPAAPGPATPNMTQSMYYPSSAVRTEPVRQATPLYGANVDYSRGTPQQQQFGGTTRKSKLDERVAARSLANMF